MTRRGAGRIATHPYLVAYLAALLAVWVVTVATWRVRPGATPELGAFAQVLQYLLVVVAATLAALRLRIERPDVQGSATFGFYDYRWGISDTISGTSFWTAVGIGMLAMVLNIVLLVAADLVAGGGAAGVGTYASWIGAGIGAGAVIGMFSAVLALLVASVVRLVRRR